jgi:hypothetical protein
VLFQYLELLTLPDIMSLDEYAANIIPSLADLNVLYGVSIPICMQIIRPVLHKAILVRAVLRVWSILLKRHRTLPCYLKSNKRRLVGRLRSD